MAIGWRSGSRARRAVIAVLAVGAGITQAAPASPSVGEGRPPVAWRSCGNGVQCASVQVPRDYDADGQTFELALARLPATEPQNRIGSLLLNPGGPGGSGTAMVFNLVAHGPLTSGPFAALNRRFDLVGFDPRGVGDSRPAIRCLTDAEAQAQFALPLPRAETVDVPVLVSWARGWVERCRVRNPGALRFMSTGNAARDLDRLRAAVGDRRLTYLGYSYGTQLGATYAHLFPNRTRALVLDGAIDLDTWLWRPLEATRQQAVAFEHALGRFFACAERNPLCAFTHDDPEVAYDELAERLDRQPIPGNPGDPRPVTGDTLRVATAEALYAKTDWPNLAQALELAAGGDGSWLQDLADELHGIRPNGTYTYQPDRLLVIAALDQRNPPKIETYLRASIDTAALAPHFWWGSGYLDLPWGLLRVPADGVFRGPFEIAPDSPPALVIGTTYDPATPYVWAKRMTAQLGNARLLTMVGDGHTAFGGTSACINDAVVAYLETLALPPEGTRCRQGGLPGGVAAAGAPKRAPTTTSAADAAVSRRAGRR